MPIGINNSVLYGLFGKGQLWLRHLLAAQFNLLK